MVSQFERLLADLVRAGVDFAVVGDVRIAYLHPEQLIGLKRDSWRDKDRLDVLALSEILRREAAEAADSRP